MLLSLNIAKICLKLFSNASISLAVATWHITDFGWKSALTDQLRSSSLPNLTELTSYLELHKKLIEFAVDQF